MAACAATASGGVVFKVRSLPAQATFGQSATPSVPPMCRAGDSTKKYWKGRPFFFAPSPLELRGWTREEAPRSGDFLQIALCFREKSRPSGRATDRAPLGRAARATGPDCTGLPNDKHAPAWLWPACCRQRPRHSLPSLPRPVRRKELKSLLFTVCCGVKRRNYSSFRLPWCLCTFKSKEQPRLM